MKTFLKPLKPASLFIFLFLMMGILLGNLLPKGVWYFLPFVCCSAVLLMARLTDPLPTRAGFVLILCLAACVGYGTIQQKLYPDLPGHHVSRFLDQKKSRITGKVVAFAVHQEKKSRVAVQCRTIELNGQVRPMTGKIFLNIYQTRHRGTLPEFGDLVQFESTVRSIHNFLNPGAFDYQKFLHLRGIFGTAYTDDQKLKIVPPHRPMPLFVQLVRKIEHLRSDFAVFVIKQSNSRPAGPILAALITGKKEMLAPGMRDLFARAGISHLFAISGLHLSIIAWVFYSIFYHALSFVPRALITGKAKKTASILTFFPLVGYSIFSGFSPSTQRALIMTLVFLLSFVSEREKDNLSSLSIAGILILALDASALFSISFQLSFAAVYFILAGLSLIRHHPFFFKSTLKARLGLMMGVTLFANIGTLPLTVRYFNLVSAVGLISNLIFIPVIGFVILPAGIVSLMLFTVFPGAAGLIIELCQHLVTACVFLCEILISIPFSWFRLVSVQWPGIAVVYLGIFSIFSLARGNRKKAAVLVSLACVLGAGLGVHDHLARTPAAAVTVTILDVGQGSSALIQTREGHHVLVDGGGFSDTASFDTGRWIVAPFLWQKKIQFLDCIILTHPESDHMNGLIYILQNFKVGLLVKNANVRDSTVYSTLTDTCRQRQVKIWTPGPVADQLCLQACCLTFLDTSQALFSDNLNNTSLVFKLIFQEFSMLFTGDILKEREKTLVQTHALDLRSDILLAPHHGSSTSSTKIFLDQIQPESVVISCGRRNRYGFPHDTVLKRYGKLKVQIFRTDLNGAITISSDGRTHTITPYKGG